MTIAVRHYSSGAENVASAYAIRQRLWGKPRLVNIAPPRIVEPEPVPLRYWQIHKTRFDSHVYAHRRWLEALEQPWKVFVKRRCKEMGVPYLKVMGRSRETVYTLPRQILMWEIKTFFKPDISYPTLGRLFNRDHKTAFYAVHKISAMTAKGEI